MTVSPLRNLSCVSFCSPSSIRGTGRRKGSMLGQEDTAFRPLQQPLPPPLHSHLANKPILIHRSSLLSSGKSRYFRPHFLHILQHHVAMSVEGLDTCEQLAVVAAGNQDLGVRADGSLEDGERAGGELVLLELGDFELAGWYVSEYLVPIGAQ